MVEGGGGIPPLNSKSDNPPWVGRRPTPCWRQGGWFTVTTIQKVFNKVPDAKAEALRLLEMGIKPPPPERPLPKPRHKCDPKFECGVKTVANRAVLNNINCHSRSRESNMTLPQHQGHPNPKMPAGLPNINLCGKGRGSKRSESKTLEPGTIYH